MTPASRRTTFGGQWLAAALPTRLPLLSGITTRRAAAYCLVGILLQAMLEPGCPCGEEQRMAGTGTCMAQDGCCHARHPDCG